MDKQERMLVISANCAERQRLHLVSVGRDLAGTLPELKGLHAAGAGDLGEPSGGGGGGRRGEGGCGGGQEEVPSCGREW